MNRVQYETLDISILHASDSLVRVCAHFAADVILWQMVRLRKHTVLRNQTCISQCQDCGIDKELVHVRI